MVIIDCKFSKIIELVKDITLKDLEETLADMGFELDDVQGDEIKIEITAERTDLITPEGVARAINAYKGNNLGFKNINVKESSVTHKVNKAVKDIRAYTRSFIVKGISLSDDKIKELMTVQEKIHATYGRKRKKVAIGVYDLDLIKFPVTYTAKEKNKISFIPLGENEEMTAEQILTENKTGKEFANLLDGLDKFPLQIDANNNILSLPPIINSNNLGNVNPKTKNLFVESTGLSYDALDNIMNILAIMFNDMGGKIESVQIDDPEEIKERKAESIQSIICPSFTSKTRKITIKEINTLIGIDVDVKKAAKLLERMQYNIIEKGADFLIVEYPATRTDIWHSVDIADDVARAYGYNNIVPTLPEISTISSMLPSNMRNEEVAKLLVGLGMIEVKTFALTNQTEQYDSMQLLEKDVPNFIALGSTEDKNLNMVRTWLLPELIKALVANRSSEYPQKIFEIGTCVLPSDAKEDFQTGAKNVEKLSSAICDNKADFTAIKQILDSVMNFLDIKYETLELKHPSFIEGRCAKILVDKKEVGLIGELHPQVLINWELMVPVAAFELDLYKL